MTVTHGLSRTLEYRIWRGMITRCTNPNRESWKKYGGRGISVCARWRSSFESFLADMGPRPSPRHSIEREDNDGNYEPGNCRWATATEQGRNTRRTKLWEHDGRRLTVMGWSEVTGMSERALWGRIQLGWPIERVLTEPIGTQDGNAKLKREEVAEIRRLRADGADLNALAVRYLVSDATISRACRGVTFRAV